MKQLHYPDILPQLTERLKKGGVFLTVGGDTPNTMTIGWGTAGWIWKKPVFMAMVRPQRHTFELLNRAGEFTLSIPAEGTMARQLAYAGTQSGANEDKFAGHGLSARPAQVVAAPIVDGCEIYLECRVLSATDLPTEGNDEAMMRDCYPAKDMHRMYFGEVVACYTTL